MDAPIDSRSTLKSKLLWAVVIALGDTAIRTMPVLLENGNVEGKTRRWESEL